jgi:prepilin signal peptidase PulO-like enzyme (type II secretory pathway)
MIQLILFLFGLTFGSFVNALVWRLHEQSKVKKPRKDLSITKGRSQCVNCGHTLSAVDLIPVLSWLSLGGKCRYCKKPISAQYPAVELLVASLFVLSYSFWPYAQDGLFVGAFISWLATVVVLLALLVYDARWMILPNRLVAIVSGLATALIVFLGIAQSNPGVVVIAAVSAGLLFGLFYGLFQISKGRWIGGGDVKLAPALGLLAGTPAKAALLIFIASVVGTIITLPMLYSKKLKKNSQIPFGPLLIIAAVVVFLFGEALINWYTSKILYM